MHGVFPLGVGPPFMLQVLPLVLSLSFFKSAMASSAADGGGDAAKMQSVRISHQGSVQTFLLYPVGESCRASSCIEWRPLLLLSNLSLPHVLSRPCLSVSEQALPTEELAELLRSVFGLGSRASVVGLRVGGS